jgi:hypothetical protein
MKRKITSLDGLYEVPESLLMEAVRHIPDHEESGIRDVLSAAEEYKSANMTPVFILDQYSMNVMVVARETFGKKLH